MELLYLHGVSSLELDVEACNGCRLCAIVCPRGVLAVRGKKALIVEKDACIECGACARNCSRGALSVRVGVGCAAAVINNAIGRRNACCVIEE